MCIIGQLAFDHFDVPVEPALDVERAGMDVPVMAGDQHVVALNGVTAEETPFGVVLRACIRYRVPMNHHALDSRSSPQSLIGTWRRFGPIGPVYEIVGIGKTLPTGDEAMRVRVLETNEEIDYRLTDLLDDPIEG